MHASRRVLANMFQGPVMCLGMYYALMTLSHHPRQGDFPKVERNMDHRDLSPWVNLASLAVGGSEADVRFDYGKGLEPQRDIYMRYISNRKQFKPRHH